ncbi:MAG TPA: BrnT family toxin [Afifellaceae bacterium]|nr:BrnT family toxin [Afifellaceae bacterium]
MEFEWDDPKAASNLQRHGIAFSAAERFDWESAVVLEDHRKAYGETRFRAFGRIGGRLHCLVYTWRAPRLRIISLRKANEREERRYRKAKGLG